MGPELHAPVIVAVFVSSLSAVELLAAMAWPSLSAQLAAALPLLVASRPAAARHEGLRT